MPVSVTYPGVYIEEIPSPVRTIVGVSTAVTAFVGYTPKGPVNKALRVQSFAEYERKFGLSLDSELGYALEQFFKNGGAEAWVVRVASSATAAQVTLKEATGTNDVLTIVAHDEGDWGNLLRIDVDYNTANPDSTFNLHVTQNERRGGDLVLVREEIHRNLSMDSASSTFAEKVVNADSQLVDVSRAAGLAGPLADPGWSLSGNLAGFPAVDPSLPQLDDEHRFIAITVNGDGRHEIALFAQGTPPPATLGALATAIQGAVTAISGEDRFTKFKATVVAADGGATPPLNYLMLKSGDPVESSSVQVARASQRDAARSLRLGLGNGGREGEAAAAWRPHVTGTLGGDLAAQDPTALDLVANNTVHVKGVSAATLDYQYNLSGGALTSFDAAAKRLQERLRKAAADGVLGQAMVEFVGNRIHVRLPQEDYRAALITFDPGGNASKELLLDGDPRAASQQYAPTGGHNGNPPAFIDLMGDEGSKSGLYALDDVDLFNILCIPRIAGLGDAQYGALYDEAATYCTRRRAFFLLDPQTSLSTVDGMAQWAGKVTPYPNAAVYFPPLLIPDVLDDARLKPRPPSGTIAGLYARTDGARGVWKAPAGIEATLAGVLDFAAPVNDAENGTLNPLGVNCLRDFPNIGRVSWGARTLDGNDARASQWKYVPVRRLALYIEESLFRGTKWVVFEGNDEPLWAQIRLNVGAFMHTLFRQGAFAGTKPMDAYFVRCDATTTTQDDINRGVVNIIVGFAPLKPAEFVILQITQIAGQMPT